jgi:hypothetical protein
LEPAAGPFPDDGSPTRKRASFDLHRYASPLVLDIEKGDIRRLTTLEGFAWAVTNLPYKALEELATHLIGLGVRDRCSVALLLRAEWFFAKARRKLVHEHPHFAGAVMLTAPRWVEPTQDSKRRATISLGGVGRDAARRRSLAQIRGAGGLKPLPVGVGWALQGVRANPPHWSARKAAQKHRHWPFPGARSPRCSSNTPCWSAPPRVS